MKTGPQPSSPQIRRERALEIDTCWDGIEAWAASQGIILHDQFSDLLAASTLSSHP